MRPFVGRAEELRALVELDSDPSVTAAAHVTGEPGSGKSRVLAEARTLLSGSHSLAVVGFESGQDVPFAAAGGLLRSLAAVPEHGEPGTYRFECHPHAGTMVGHLVVAEPTG